MFERNLFNENVLERTSFLQWRKLNRPCQKKLFVYKLEKKNFNGVMVTLNIQKLSDVPNAKSFTISYKSGKKSSSWWQISLILAIIFNMIAVAYLRVNITAIMIVIIIFSFLLFFWITHCVQSESVLVIPTVGVQTSVKYVLGNEDKFIPWSNVDDIIINEVLLMCRVLFHLTIITKVPESDTTTLIPLFKYTRPRLTMITKVYQQIQMMLEESIASSSGLAAGDTGGK